MKKIIYPILFLFSVAFGTAQTIADSTLTVGTVHTELPAFTVDQIKSIRFIKNKDGYKINRIEVSVKKQGILMNISGKRKVKVYVGETGIENFRKVKAGSKVEIRMSAVNGSGGEELFNDLLNVK